MFALYSLYLLLINGLFIKWMWRMCFFIVIWLKIYIYIWLLLKIYYLHLRVCASSNDLYIVWNKHPKHGIRNFVPLYMGSPLSRASMTHLYLFIAHLQLFFYFFFTLMIWSLLDQTRHPYRNLNNSNKPHLIWKTLVTCIISLALRFILLLRVYFFISISM